MSAWIGRWREEELNSDFFFFSSAFIYPCIQTIKCCAIKWMGKRTWWRRLRINGWIKTALDIVKLKREMTQKRNENENCDERKANIRNVSSKRTRKTGNLRWAVLSGWWCIMSKKLLLSSLALGLSKDVSLAFVTPHALRNYFAELRRRERTSD